MRARRAAETATASERRLRTIALQAPELAMLLIDADHRYVMIEGMPFERSGVPLESVLGRTIAEVITDERREPLIAHVDRALAGESGAFDIFGPATQTVYRVHYAPFVENDVITHAALTLRDVGSELELQRSVESQRRFLSAVLAQLGDRVRVSDADGRLLAFDGSGAGRRAAPTRVGGALRPRAPRRAPARPARDAAAARVARVSRSPVSRSVLASVCCWRAAGRSTGPTASSSARSSSTPT